MSAATTVIDPERGAEVQVKEAGEVEMQITIPPVPPMAGYEFALSDQNYVCALSAPHNRFQRLLQALVGISWRPKQ